MARITADNVEFEGKPEEFHDGKGNGHHYNHSKESCMNNDLAGLLALVQQNKNMDLPGLLALCKEKGYGNGFGGEWIWAFLLIILFANGGWGGLRNSSKEEFAHLAGQNLQDIIGIYDRLASNQTATQQGFTQLDTKICSSIAEVITAVRNQGDRTYDATRNVGDAVRDCCCEMRAKLAELGCKVDGLYGHTSLLQERTVNEVNKRACEIENELKDMRAAMALGFERVECKITNTALQQESDRKDREIASLKDTIRSTEIANRAVAQLQEFATAHWAPTRTTPTTPA